MSGLGRIGIVLCSLALLGCAEPDIVELGGACKEQVECKDPADTCVTLGAESLCSMACSADSPCPDEYVCAKMDIQVSGADGAGKADAQGMCLAASRVGPHAATIKPTRKAKRKAKRNKRKKKRAEAKDDTKE